LPCLAQRVDVLARPDLRGTGALARRLLGFRLTGLKLPTIRAEICFPYRTRCVICGLSTYSATRSSNEGFCRVAIFDSLPEKNSKC
jgi:hypothetical protein